MHTTTIDKNIFALLDDVYKEYGDNTPCSLIDFELWKDFLTDLGKICEVDFQEETVDYLYKGDIGKLRYFVLCMLYSNEIEDCFKNPLVN